jgi:putative aldouronate transport system substrate-binding protein
MKRKMILVSLIAMLTANLLTGCSAKTKTPTTTTAPDKKYTIKIFTSRNQPEPTSEVMKQVQQKIGGHTLEVTAVNDADYNAKLNLYFASNEMPDVFTSNANASILKGGTAKFTEEELQKYMPLSYAAAVKQYEMYGVSKQYVLDKFTVNGKLAGFSMGTYLNTVPYGITIRTDKLQELGKSVPKTISDWEEIFKAQKQKNSATYQIAARGKDAPVQNFYIFISAFGTTADKWVLKDNKLVWGPFMPEMREALALLQNWYKAGYINPEFFTMDNQALNNEAIKGNMIYTQFSSMGTKIEGPFDPGSRQEQTLAKDPNTKWDWAPFPVAKQGVKPAVNVYEGVMEQPQCYGKHLDTDRDKLHAVMGVMDKLGSDAEVLKLVRYGISGVHYDIVNGVPTYKKEFTTTDAQKKEGINWFYFGNSGTNWDVEKQFVAPIYTENIKNRVQDSKGIYSKTNIEYTWNRVNGPLTSPSGEDLTVKGKAKNDEWMGVLAQVVTGKMTISDFDKFIETWKKEVGDEQTEAANRLYLKQWQK